MYLRAFTIVALLAASGGILVAASWQTAVPPTRQTTSAPKPPKHSGPACVSAEDAGKTPNKDVCVSAHVFEVVELADGTRFLDICPADVADDACRFTLLSLPGDREDVGDLRRYRDQNVTVRGIVRATHGRMGIVISHVRQFNGGPEKFRPNPRLLKDFNGQSDRMPVRDPNLAGSGRHRGFMNSNDKEALTPTQKR